MKRKKIVIIISTIVFMLSILAIVLLFCKKDNLIYDEKIISNSFEYEQEVTNESIEDIYYYSDSYFKESSTLENEHLRSFSFALAAAFNPTYRKDEVNYNLNKIYDELNFCDVVYYDLNEFSENTIGTSIAHKKLNEKYELIVIVLRGAGYKGEWLSNFDLGKEGPVKGFAYASMYVMKRLDDYLIKYDIKDYKLLITGYSRAGAVAGLFGEFINTNKNYYNVDMNDLFVYTFDAPRYSDNDNGYSNIHDVINENDIVTYVYPESWGLYHSGKEEIITSNEKIIDEYYLDIFSSDKIKKNDQIDLERFIRMFINNLPNDRVKYNKISNSISKMYLLINSKSSFEKKKLINYLKENKINIDLNNSINLLSLINSDDKKLLRKNFDLIMSNYDKNYYEIKSILSEEEYNNLKDNIFNIYLFLQPSIRNEYKSNHMFSLILTFYNNLDIIFKEHYFSTNFEQIKNKDSYYKNA